MIPYFKDLGDRIDADYRGDARTLPEVAVHHLVQRPSPSHTSLDELLRWVSTVADARFVRQRDMGTTFGEPPVTVYRGSDFCIDVNLWASSSTQIHEHAFTGAFQLLAGSSLQSRYAFHEDRKVGDIGLGRLAFLGAERLLPGDVWPIAPGAGLIHGLFHLHHPTATVVVRTYGEPELLPQRSFDAPGLAYDGQYPSQFSMLTTRRLQLVHFLASAGVEDGQHRLAEICEGADPLLVYQLFAEVLPEYWSRGPSSLSSLDDAVARAFASVTWEDDELGDMLATAGRRRMNRRMLLRQRQVLTEVEDREIAGALLCSPDRAAVEALLAAWYPERAPIDQVLSLVQRRQAELGLDDAWRDALMALVRDEPVADEAVVRELRLSLFASWLR
ncbi:MAG: hypothetical protein EP330_16885 [Deltaproteobacteria bacterium]|nr:MAG: hypothetical protein EP330_16885 [Deltaproteobacteria bacterium]